MGKRYSCLILFLLLIPLGFSQSGAPSLVPGNPPGGIGGACTATTFGYLTPAGQIVTCVANVWTVSAGSSGGTITSVATTTPITGGTFTTSGTIACPTCGVTGSGLGQFALTTSAQLASVISDESGTGVLVYNTSPTFITPALGTPASGILTNETGLPVSTGISGLGTGVATFLATASSANLLAALTTKTGTGLAMFGTSPTASGLTLSDVASGSIQCVQASATGVLSGTGLACGSGGGSGVTSIATTSPITGGTITSTGTLACPTCTTNASALGNTQIMTGAGSQASQTPSSVATVDSSGNIKGTSIATGTSPPAVTAGTGGVVAAATEGTAPSVCTAVTVDCVYADSTQHGLLASFNNGSYLPLIQGPASSTSGNVVSFNATNGGLTQDTGIASSDLFRLSTAQSVSAVKTFPGGDLFAGGVNAQVGTSYAIVTGDENKLLTFNNASSVAVSLSQATTTGFTSGAFFHLVNRGAGAVTITPATSTINGSATLVLNQNQGAFIVSDGTNYSAWVSAAPTGSGTVTSAGGSFTGGLISVGGSPITTSGTLAFTVAGTSGGIPYFSSASTWASSAALTAGGLVAGGGAGASPQVSAAGTSKQIAISGGAGAPSFIDLPIVLTVPAANCNAGTAGAGWSTATSNFTAACRAGSNNLGGALQAIPSTGASGQFTIELPVDWDTAVQPWINIFYASGANTSGTVIWTVSSACTKADGSVTDDPAFNAESAFASQTMATANRTWSKTGQFTAMSSGNNCIAGSQVTIKLAVSGTAGSNINAYQAVVTIPTLPANQAN